MNLRELIDAFRDEGLSKLFLTPRNPSQAVLLFRLR